MLVDITCTINGRERNLAVEATELLVDTLRLRLGLTGTKKACERALLPSRGWEASATCTRSSRPSLTPEPYSAATARPV